MECFKHPSPPFDVSTGYFRARILLILVHFLRSVGSIINLTLAVAIRISVAKWSSGQTGMRGTILPILVATRRCEIIDIMIKSLFATVDSLRA